MERHEKRRRRMNGAYDQALKELDTVSLKNHEQSMAYQEKWYLWFCVLRDELICQARRRRRFTRFRARQCVLQNMVQTAVYGCEERSFKKNKHKLLQAYKCCRITNRSSRKRLRHGRRSASVTCRGNEWCFLVRRSMVMVHRVLYRGRSL